jgi:uncharacterized protein (DUF1015 family)
MVETIPLRGLRYATEYATASVYAPPYDVISPAQQQQYLAHSPHNIVRLILGPSPNDDQWHGSAAVALERWRNQGILVREEQPVFYGYQQHFSLATGGVRKRSGLVGRVRLSEWGTGIYRHERTRVGPRADRLRLMQATRANLSPVFGLYHDPTGDLASWLEPPTQPEVAFRDDEGVEQIFWRIAAPEAIAALQKGLAEREIVIADGHHRYETALAYRAERRAAEGNPAGLRAYDYVLMYLTAVEDPGLCILPTHRVVAGQPPIDAQGLLRSLSGDFEVTPLAPSDSVSTAIARAAMADGQGVAIGLCLGLAGTWVLRLKNLERARRAAMGDVAPGLSELDVVVLQNMILGPTLGISTEALATTDRLSYTISEVEACESVQRGRAQVAFILNPTSVTQVWQAATRGTTMPQKSTYFYPKLLSGLVLNPLDED